MIICRCEEVTQQTIEETIQNGACTAREVKLRTRASMGICQGRTCRPLIDCLLQQTDSSSSLDTLKSNHPVRPVLLEDIFRSEGARER